MEKSRIAVVCSIKAAHWTSCAVIATNLAEAYRQAFGKNAKFFTCESWDKPSDIKKTALRIHRFNPERIVFLDHMPHPDTILMALKALQILPPLVFHVYGDFSRTTQRWLAIEDILKGTPVIFVCASHRQLELISRFLARPRSNTAYLPFPTDSTHFFANQKLRASWRKRIGAGDDEIICTYAGRISLQKNNLQLLKEIIAFSNGSGRKVRFVNAGTFDDIGAPLFGIFPEKGESKKQWMSLLRSLKPYERKTVLHLGELNAKELRGLYNATDIYCSLSLYHDEDFGMAPAEALCCGTPNLLSDWGGYSSFRLESRASSACELVPIKFTKRGTTIPSSDIQKALETLSRLGSRPHDRLRRSHYYLKNFSVEAVAEKLRPLHRISPPNFPGFSTLLRKQVNAQSRTPMFPEGQRKGALYEKVYGAYFH